MAGIHLHWRKQRFRSRWILHGVAGYTGNIAAIPGPAHAVAWSWSVRRIAAERDAPDATGVAASFSEARLFASRAAFTLVQQHAGLPDRLPAEPPSGALVAPR